MQNSESLYTSTPQHDGGSSFNTFNGILPVGIAAMEIKEQLHERPAFSSEASTCMEAHQVDACRDMPEKISNQRNLSSRFSDETASPMMAQAQEASQSFFTETRDDSTAHSVVVNSVESRQHINLSSQAELVAEEGGKEETMETDNADFDIINDQKDSEFFLYLLVSPHPKTVRTSSYDGHKGDSVQVFQPLKLPEQAMPYVGNYACWRLRVPQSFSRMGFRVMVTFPKAKLLGTIPLPGLKELTLHKYFERRRKSMQIEFIHKKDPENREHMKLALNSVLVLLSNPSILSDCFAECAPLNTRMYHGYLMSESDLKRNCDWLAWIQQEFQEPGTESSNIEWASRMVPALLGQFHLVKHLLKINELPKFIEEHCVKLLQLYANFVLQLGSLQRLPSSAVTTMQQLVADLVNLTPASQWSLHLGALCNADPLYIFLKRWKARWVNIRTEKDRCEKDYEDAIFHILNFCETYPDGNFKLKAIRAAILATPSGTTFLRSIHLFLCSNLLPDLATEEEAERFVSGDDGQALINHFKWLVEVESPKIMVRLLIKELSSIDSKVLRTFIRILSTILLRWQILPLTKRVLGEMDSPRASFDNLIEIWTCPHTFIAPLLSHETILMYDIASKGDLEFAAHVILALVKKLVSGEDLQYKGGIWDDIRTWLHKVCARAADAIKETTRQAPMTPHVLYSKVANLFGEGLQLAGFLAEAVGEIVSRLVQQRFCLQEVIQDAGKMSFFDCDEIAQHYCSFAKKALSKYLHANKHVGYEGLDNRATEILNWLCTRAQGDITLNGWIQEAFCTFLLDVLNDIGAENPSACDGTLVESTFKLLLLQLKLAPASHVALHAFYQSLLMEWTTLEKELEEQSISIGRVIKLMNHPLALWECVCKVHKASSKTLTDAVAEVNCYMNTFLKAFHMLLDYAMLIKGCGFTSIDLHEAQSWLEKRYNRYKNFTLRELKDPKHWPLILDAHFFEAMLILRRSKILENIFRVKAPQVTPMGFRIANEEETDNERDDVCSISELFPDQEEIVDKHDIGDAVSWLWQYVATIMRVSVNCYVEEWKNLSNAFYPVEKLSDLLCGLTNNEIEVEGNLAEGFLRFWQENVPQNFQAILAALTAWVNLQEKRAFVAPLVEVERMLNIDEDGSKLSATLQSLCDVCIVGSLGECLELYNNNLEALNYFSSKEIVVIKQIAVSEKLISFLKERSGDDFRLLTDAIEEQAEDVLIDEATISDLIYIDKVFRPLLKSETLSLAHLKSALGLETQNMDSAQLCSKLSFCTINIHRIQQFVTSLADRSSVLRMNMYSIMQSGVYDVAIVSQNGVDRYCHKICSFSLKINYLAASDSNQNSRQHFSLSELIDLRSRARMLLSRRKVQVTCNEQSMSPTNCKFQVQALEEFVEFISLIENFVNQVSHAHKSGHFLFGSFKWSGSGIYCLQEKVRWIDGQLTCWNAALDRARSQFNCLNFFRGVELRLIHHCFSSEATTDQIQICYELLNFVKPGLDRNQVEKCLASCICRTENERNIMSGEGSELQTYTCLQHLSSMVQGLFTSVIPGSTFNQIIEETANSDKTEDSVLLITVEEKHLEFNVVVEIFSKHKKHIRSQQNNLILCSSTTSWEEVHLLLLRYSSSDDYDDSHVFVIAFIEKLSFECQLQLALALESQQMAEISRHQRVKNRLVLVCWIGSQALQGISHHLKVPIQYMNGYAKNIIELHLPGECTHMRVVTSELAGMGKSSSIKAHGSCVTITISREITLESFILKLKNTNISAENSLHLDITTEEGYESLNRYLFELLILGVLKSSYVGAFWLAVNNIYVELANTLGNRLETNLSVCSWLPHEHCVWELESLHVSEDLGSDEQVVCLYLDALVLMQLDTKDIVMCGTSTNVSPLPESRCKELLYQFFIKDSCQMSYSVLAGFLRTLAYQLRKLSATDFYTVETLCWILRSPTPANFRSNLVASLVQAAKELSLRSVKPWLHGEQQQVLMEDLNTSMHMRMSSLLGWSDSNHVIIFFDMYGPVTVLYRDKKLIPEAIKSIMMIQAEVMGTQLLDYSILPSLTLWRILSPILGKDIPAFAPNYALTPDNFLKMALISLRINTQVPVIVMGETGCGKTSLLKALATCSNASLSCLTLHAGSTEQDIESFILTASTRALSENTQVWAFLDEINACHHLGFLNGILCHHTMDGNLLPPNLVVLAACNPYRLQDPESKSVGLQSTKGSQSGHQSMAYKVQPLPEAMLDYVWDYGILSDNDERSYICAMIGTRRTDIIDVLCNSQKFMRCHLGLSSVSLRDIQRWTLLFDWLQVDVAARAQLNKKPGVKNVEGRSKVLACFLCYDCRLPTKDLRMLYREMCCKYLRFNSEIGRGLKASKLENMSPSFYGRILHKEQLDILQRMEIPPGIAMNTSLLENVFVVLVCMLNCLPVFVVGKPGSGKTLALQIIYSNLRGADSKDLYYKQLPRMLMLSYQGSQNSTSEGILKVFEKAKRYVESNRKRDMLVVLVLDEIGLAETSGHNPLKVLHPLLEPDVQEIAVVGISNWSLDAAKMNRGIHLSQSDPEEEDLFDTGLAILKSYNAAKCHPFEEKLRGLVSAYVKYHAQQVQADFHGLRDFYSLIKSLRLCSSTVFEQEKLAHSLWRNFGGGRYADIQIFFSDVEELTGCKGLCSQPPPVMELIRSNLQDSEARHLLLITKGDSASSILQHMLQQDDEFAIIQGGSYKDDKNEESCYLLLGEIILHMEMGRRVLLQNADQVWSSLYDMLNQHYTIVGGRKNCRIALGIYSNPMCYVHDKFRCIVIVDHEHIPQLDPPFLNRFEKQTLTYECILSDPQRRAVESIRTWAHELAASSLVAGCPDSAWNDAERQFFSGFFEDSVPSLVMYHWNIMRTEASDCSQLIYRCKVDLLQTANVNAIARAHLQQNSEKDEFERWTDMFLSWDAVHSLDELIKLHVSSSESWADSIGVKIIVTTFTPLQWSIQQDIESTAASSQIKVYCLRLGDFTSKKQLQTHIDKFWTDRFNNLLVLQADDVSDRDHISLAKFHIDKARKTVTGETTAIQKHVLLILHVQQGRTRLSRFSYLCGWKQLTIDRLQKEAIHLRVYLEKSIPEILDNTAMPIKRIMVRVLTWSYLCIKFEDRTIPASYPQKMVQLICEDEAMFSSLKQRAVEWFLERKESLWQLTVLNNQKLLSTSASVHDAFVQYLEENFRECLARLLYLTEKTSSLSSYFLYDTQKQQVWRDLLLTPGFLNYNLAPPPCYPEGYTLEKPLDLQIPFSSWYAAHVDNTFRQPFMENISRQGTLGLNFYASGIRKPSSIQRDVDASLTPTLAIIKTCIDNDLESYVVDFCNLVYHKNLQSIKTKNQALEWAVRENLQAEIYHASDVHIVYWEREKEIKDQAALASLCLATEVIDQHVRELRAGRPPSKSFKEDLAIQCCLSLLPTKTCLKKVGIEGWITKVKVLLKCVLPVGGPDMVFFLQTMHVFAVCVILPLHLDSQHLSTLAAWFVNDSKELCTSSIVRKVVATLPNLGMLSNQRECRCWMDFLCCMLKHHPHLPSLSEDDLKIILLNLLTSASPSCMMGHALFQLLNTLFSSRTNLLKGQNSIFEALFFSNCEDLLNVDWEDEINLTNTLFLVDFVYHKLRGEMIPVLMNSEQKQEWDLENFTKCLSLALQACEDGVPLSLKKVMALIFVKCFLYSTASLLSEAYLNRLRIKNYCQSVQSTLSMISPNLKHAFQVFFVKILHWDFGLSADDISSILNYCEKEAGVETFSFLLENSLVRNVHNRLGFNPFMTSSDSCKTAEVAMEKLVLSSNREKQIGCGRESDEEVMSFLRNAGQKEQAAFITAIASRFFVMKSGGPLSDAEWNAMKQVQGLLDNLSNWDPLAKQSLKHLTASTPGGVWHCCEHLTTESLRIRCLILDVLVTAMKLPMESPLRGYCMLSPSHLTGASVLTELDNVLQGVDGLGSYREYLCGCGYMYIIGDCTRPSEVGTCPKCNNTIGGHAHVLRPGNIALREVNSQRVMERSLAGKAAFSVRIQPLSYRLLRILVHYCFLIGITIGGDNTILTAFLDPANHEPNLTHVLTSLIEADMDLLDKLIACQREMTYQLIHSVLRKLPQVCLEGPLLTPQQRDEWEMAFEKVVNSQPPHESISEYLQQNRTDGLNDVLQERDTCPSAAPNNYFRMTKKPSFSHYGTMFVQNTVRAAQFPCVAAVLAHTKHLSSLPFLLPIVEFGAVLDHVIGHKITRQAATTTIIQDILWDKSDVVEKYELFEASWNSVRLLVKGYECHQFKDLIPAMHKAQPIGLCLIEKRDQGLYLIAILEFLRSCQNNFLDEVKAGLLCSPPGHQFFDSADARNMPSICVQDCKAEHVVCFDEKWANDLVNELGMCNPAYGKGTQVEYDDYHIDMEMQRRLIQGKAFLEGDYTEFPYQQESFQRHATLISDIIDRVTQDPLPAEKLSNINRELTMEGLGPWQLLVTLELCLGYLRKMNAEPSELLRDYCERWLGVDAHPIMIKGVFDGIEVRHVVSLYEGLEAVASLSVEDMVSPRYRADLDAGMHQDLLCSVVVRKAGWASPASSSKAKLGAEAFRDVLKRFMFRYLTTDTFKPEDELQMYLTNEGLVTWPAEDLEAAGGSLEAIFPRSFQLRHARALYLALKQMCS